MPDFKTAIDRLVTQAVFWFSIYVRVIFGLAAIGIGYAVIESVFFPTDNRAVKSSLQANDSEHSQGDRPRALPPR
jgi:hypothetical protein